MSTITECTAALAQATVHIDSTDSSAFSQAFIDYMASDTFRQEMQSRQGNWGISLDVPVVGSLGINSNSGSDDWAQFKQQVSHLQAGDITETNAQHTILQFADRNTVQIFQSCIQAGNANGNRSDIVGDVTPVNNQLVVKLTYDKIFQGDPDCTIQDFTYAGVTITHTPFQINDVWQGGHTAYLVFLRNPDEPAIITITTSRGGWSYVADVQPPPQATTTPPPVVTPVVKKVQITITTSEIYNTIYILDDVSTFQKNQNTVLPAGWQFTPTRIYIQEPPPAPEELICEIWSMNSTATMLIQTAPIKGSITINTDTQNRTLAHDMIYQFPLA